MHPNPTGLFSNLVLSEQYAFPPRTRTPLQQGWENMYKSIKTMFFHKSNYNHIVYCSVGNIEFFDNEEKIMPEKEVLSCNKKGLNIFLYEPISTYDIRNKDASDLYVEYEIEDLKYIRSNELDSIQKYVIRSGLTNVSVYTPNYKIADFFGDKYPELDLMCSPVGWVYPVSMKVNPNLYEEDTITKKFWCGNWRYTPTRHLISSYLVDQVDSNDYNLSYIYESNQDILKNQLWFDIDNLKKKDSILTGAEVLGIKTPLTLDQNLDKPYNINDTVTSSHFNNNPVDTYIECFCSILTETRYAEYTNVLTEKSMFSMLNCRPFIMVGAPGNLEYMKRWGFETFDNWWDESYDKETCHYKRINKILEVIDYINSKSIDELKKIYEDMIPVLFYNQHHILNLQDDLKLGMNILKNKTFKRVRC